jgi:hypothetical protein
MNVNWTIILEPNGRWRSRHCATDVQGGVPLWSGLHLSCPVQQALSVSVCREGPVATKWRSSFPCSLYFVTVPCTEPAESSPPSPHNMLTAIRHTVPERTYCMHYLFLPRMLYVLPWRHSSSSVTSNNISFIVKLMVFIFKLFSSPCFVIDSSHLSLLGQNNPLCSLPWHVLAICPVPYWFTTWYRSHARWQVKLYIPVLLVFWFW